ncbi:uncharacterized protein PHACADRAFT_265284 [Phanerochaete carnosa HHB-10118-sp]|uniref:Uncharacterized protein n=1 Tax=Phanerochaete carnosa (strain HHB-10118-sp) TaxID=650164 RepID=K5VEW2_PHACS|nr:uncharacterized protein PHACADRAFT_265284 [Phanerochaete carnosa HHB-10118-sp]EKM49703.1 hypothetical protein PHACADRAFT_265284 [Phanerochaete carnosa HHB-10118-sp]
MKSEDTLALLDLLETSVSIVIGIVEWSRQAAWLYDHVEAGQALGDQCSPLHRWLMCQSVPNDITAEFLGCPCLTHENRLLSINMHLPPLAHNTSDLPSPPSSLHTPTSPRSPGSSCANDSLSPLHPNQTSPSRKRSVDTRTPCSVVFATQNMRRSSKRSHSQECHIFLDTSADTIVDNSILAFPEGKEQAASWEGEEDADKDASEGCSSIVVDDDFATLVGSDDGYDLDLEKHGYDYCSSTFSVDDEPASDEDGTSAEPSPSSLHDKPYTPTSYAFGGIEISTKLPLWSRFFKLVLPFWSSL